MFNSSRKFSNTPINSFWIPINAEICIAEGITSFEDWPRLTWSFGCTGVFDPISPPSFWIALFEITSLKFIFVDVPDPVWKISTRNWSSKSPFITSLHTWTIISPISGSNKPKSTLTSAAANLISASPLIKFLGNFKSLIGKFKIALIVCAPYKASLGTLNSPIESLSIR